MKLSHPSRQSASDGSALLDALLAITLLATASIAVLKSATAINFMTAQMTAALKPEPPIESFVCVHGEMQHHLICTAADTNGNTLEHYVVLPW